MRNPTNPDMRARLAVSLGLLPPLHNPYHLAGDELAANQTARRVLQAMFYDCMGGLPGVNNTVINMGDLLNDEKQKKSIRITQLRAMVMSERAVVETARILTSHVRGETMTPAVAGESFDAVTYS